MREYEGRASREGGKVCGASPERNRIVTFVCRGLKETVVGSCQQLSSRLHAVFNISYLDNGCTFYLKIGKRPFFLCRSMIFTNSRTVRSQCSFPPDMPPYIAGSIDLDPLVESFKIPYYTSPISCFLPNLAPLQYGTYLVNAGHLF